MIRLILLPFAVCRFAHLAHRASNLTENHTHAPSEHTLWLWHLIVCWKRKLNKFIWSQSSDKQSGDATALSLSARTQNNHTWRGETRARDLCIERVEMAKRQTRSSEERKKKTEMLIGRLTITSFTRFMVCTIYIGYNLTATAHWLWTKASLAHDHSRVDQNEWHTKVDKRVEADNSADGFSYQPATASAFASPHFATHSPFRVHDGKRYQKLEKRKMYHH